jgi:hypothetical protein
MTPRPTLRTVLRVLLTVTTLAVLMTGLTLSLRANRSTQSAADLRQIATRVELPPGSVTYFGVMAGCPKSQYVRCGRVDLDVDTAAREMQALLSGVAEEPAGLSCETLPSHDVVWRSCMVRIDRNGHGVMILVDPNVRRTGGHTVLLGAEVRIQSD